MRLGWRVQEWQLCEFCSCVDQVHCEPILTAGILSSAPLSPSLEDPLASSEVAETLGGMIARFDPDWAAVARLHGGGSPMNTPPRSESPPPSTTSPRYSILLRIVFGKFTKLILSFHIAVCPFRVDSVQRRTLSPAFFADPSLW